MQSGYLLSFSFDLSSGINQWRDQMKPSQILENLARLKGLSKPRTEDNGTSLTFNGKQYTLAQFGNVNEYNSVNECEWTLFDLTVGWTAFMQYVSSLLTTQSAVPYTPTFIHSHSHSHTNGSALHQLEVQYLVQGHFDMQTGGVGDRFHISSN